MEQATRAAPGYVLYVRPGEHPVVLNLACGASLWAQRLDEFERLDLGHAAFSQVISLFVVCLFV